MATTLVGAAPAAAASIKKTPKHLPAPNGGFLSVRRRFDRRGKGDRQKAAYPQNLGKPMNFPRELLWFATVLLRNDTNGGTTI
jgi:hypothetical protein